MNVFKRLYLWWFDCRLILLFRLLAAQAQIKYLRRQVTFLKNELHELEEALGDDIHERRDPHQCVLRRNDA